MTKRLSIALLAVVAIVLAMVSCQDNEATGSASITATADITFNGEPLDTSVFYPLNDFQYRFDIGRFYVGGFTANSGDEVIGDGSTYLLAKETGQVSTPLFADIDVAQGLSSISFFIGVGPDINNQSEQDFLDRSVEDPLSIQDPAMHWNWNTGYRFVRIDGEAVVPTDSITSDTMLTIDTRIDTLSNGDTMSVQDTTFSISFDTIQIFADTVQLEYHLGTDDLLTTIVADEGLDRLVAGEDNRLLIRLDIANLLRDIDLRQAEERMTHTTDNQALAIRLQQKLQEGAIGYRLN